MAGADKRRGSAGAGACPGAAGLHRLPVSSFPPDLRRGAAGSLWGGEIAAWALRFEEKVCSAKPPPYWAGAGLL